MASKTIILKVDDLDYETIMGEICRHEATAPLPDADGGNINGRVIAEVIRNLNEYRDIYDEDIDGELWELGGESNA